MTLTKQQLRTPLRKLKTGLMLTLKLTKKNTMNKNPNLKRSAIQLLARLTLKAELLAITLMRMLMKIFEADSF